MITKSITSGERAATAVISEETRFLFSTEWNFFHVKNLGTDTVYISMTAGATAGADGVIAIPTGESACTAHGYTALSVYVTAAVATDKVQVIGSNIADSPFKGGSKGGGGIDGKDGKDGIDGTNGIDGVDGKDGIDGIDGVVTALTYTGTLLSTGWSDTAPYTQTVTVTGLTTTISAPILDVVFSAGLELQKEENLQWGYICDAYTGADTLTITCFDSKPSINLNFKVLVM